MQWLFAAVAALVLASFVMTFVGAFSPSRRGWVVSAFRLRYLAFAVLFFALGLSMTISGLVGWVDWGSFLVGLFALAMGAAYVYGRGGIGPNTPSA